MSDLLYLMLIDGKRRWLPLVEAGRAYDSGWVPVEIGGLVIESGVERVMTHAERARICDIADDWSGSK